jgi:hypothetical protein
MTCTLVSVVGHGRPVGNPRPGGHGFGQKTALVTGRGFLTGGSYVNGMGLDRLNPAGLRPLPSLG